MNVIWLFAKIQKPGYGRPKMICVCGHPQYEHHTVRWFVPEDKLEISYCEHGLLKPKQPCDCSQFSVAGVSGSISPS